MAKKNNNNLWIFGIILVFLFFANKGALNNQAMVCTNNEPNTLEGFDTAFEPLGGLDFCMFMDAQNPSTCCSIGRSEQMPSLNFVLCGIPPPAGRSTNESVTVSAINQTRVTQATNCSGLIIERQEAGWYQNSSIYKGNIIYQNTDDSQTAICSHDNHFIIESYYGKSILIKYIDTYYSCQDNTPPPASTTTCQFYEKKVDGACEINMVLVIILGIIILLLFRR